MLTPRRLLTKFAGLLALLLLLFALALSAEAAQTTGKGKSAKGKSLHGASWAFGVSRDRNSPLWSKGVRAESISSRAMPKLGKAKGKAVNTGGGISRALDGRDKKRNGLALSVEKASSQWKVAPSQQTMQPDECMERESRHVLRAHTDLAGRKDLSVSVGPELTIKDEQHGSAAAADGEPDSVLGLGMRFKLDF